MDIKGKEVFMQIKYVFRGQQRDRSGHDKLKSPEYFSPYCFFTYFLFPNFLLVSSLTTYINIQCFPEVTVKFYKIFEKDISKQYMNGSIFVFKLFRDVISNPLPLNPHELANPTLKILIAKYLL